MTGSTENKIGKVFFLILISHCGHVIQGGGNAGPEQANKLEDGLAWVPLTRHLLISGRLAAVAPEDFLREKEAAVVPPIIHDSAQH
jgi:hypothetical protein